jgi:hypothetical protein
MLFTVPLNRTTIQGKRLRDGFFIHENNICKRFFFPWSTIVLDMNSVNVAAFCEEFLQPVFRRVGRQI